MDNELKKYFKGKVVLVTGGTGSIGSEIVRKLLEYPVDNIRIFSRDEYKQFVFKHELSKLPLGKVRFLIGDVRDRDRVARAMEGVDIVFNAAAMKHVPLCEYNPFEAVKTNVVGAQNVVDAALANNVEKFIHVSTDKAAMPVNVMGATKLLAEKIALCAERYKGPHRTVFAAVRFGNVFGSRGSVVPFFHEQIKQGGPVSLTDAEMTRFMLKIPQAVELVLKAALLSKGEELFILKMPVMKIADVARAMIEVLAPRYGRKARDIKIEIIGRRGGEKVYELLMTEDEAEDVYESREMFCITKNPVKGFKKTPLKQYRSDNCEVLSYPQVLDFIRRSV